MYTFVGIPTTVLPTYANEKIGMKKQIKSGVINIIITILTIS